MANKTIDQLTSTLAASTVTDPSVVRLGVGDSTSGSAVSKKIAASELMKLAPFDVVADVTALLAVTHARDNQLFQTRGYTTEGVGANLYRYDAASSATIDGGFVLPGIGGALGFTGTTFSGTAGTGRYVAVDQSVADVTKFGADSSAVNNLSSIQRAINSSDVVYVPSGSFDVNAALVLRTGSSLRGCGQNSSVINQTSSDVPIISITSSSTNYYWSISDIRLSYDTQQTTTETSALGIQLATTNVNTYLGVIENVMVSGAYRGVSLPNLTGCTAFLIRMSNVHARQCAQWGFHLEGASSGSRTNLVLNECWVENTAGSEISTRKGFYIASTDGFSLNNCGCDHIQDQHALRIDNSNGRVGVFWAESCDITASSFKTLFEFIGTSVVVDEIYAAFNNVSLSGSADFSLVRAQSGSNVAIGVLVDKETEMTDTSSGAYYTVQASSSDVVTVGEFKYTAGSSPANNGNLADFGTVKYIRIFDGNEKTSVRGSKLHVYGTSAPASGTWAVGDIMWNTSPAAAGTIGWVCTTAGTPGTWKTFGTIAS